MRLRVGSGLPNIQKDTLSKIKISFPEKKQKAISEFLFSTDKYMALQQQKLEKMKFQQKALMQLLLTGIVRV